jgi:hypothetical protein
MAIAHGFPATIRPFDTLCLGGRRAEVLRLYNRQLRTIWGAFIGACLGPDAARMGPKLCRLLPSLSTAGGRGKGIKKRWIWG